MKFTIKTILICLIGFLAACSSSESGATVEVVPGIPVKNMVTMVDLGAKTCIPCKMMAPILEELQEEYKGRAEIIFIDVWEEEAMAKKFKVAAIPTQVFYDKSGVEVFRHMGFMDKDSIVKKLAELQVR
jgi:thioredoxin 1